MPLARAIAQAVRTTRTKELADETHDVLFAVSHGHPPALRLVAVVSDAADERATELWLATAAMNVDAGLGVLDGAPVVTTRAGLTLDYLENSYSADLSDVTWGKEEPRGEE